MKIAAYATIPSDHFMVKHELFISAFIPSHTAEFESYTTRIISIPYAVQSQV